MDIEELSRKIDKYHKEDKRRAEKYRYENLGYIALGFALGVGSIAVKNVDIVDVVVYLLATAFLIFAAIRVFKHAGEIKAK